MCKVSTVKPRYISDLEPPPLPELGDRWHLELQVLSAVNDNEEGSRPKPDNAAHMRGHPSAPGMLLPQRLRIPWKCAVRKEGIMCESLTSQAGASA